MAAHKGPASSRPRCTRGGSSVAVIPVCLMLLFGERLSSAFHVQTRSNVELLLSPILCSMLYAVEVCAVVGFYTV
jgi:hypothetical protein